MSGHMKKILKLINVRHDADMDILFDKHKAHAHKINKFWIEIGQKVDATLSCEAVKTKYNYLVQEYRKHHSRAKISGEGAIKWQYYAILREYLSKDPSINPTTVVDSQSYASPTSPDISTATLEINEDFFDNELTLPLNAKKPKRANKMDQFFNVFKENNRQKPELMNQYISKFNDLPRKLLI